MKVTFSKFVVIVSAIVLLTVFFLLSVRQYCDLLTSTHSHHGTAITEKPTRVLVIKNYYGIVEYIILNDKYQILKLKKNSWTIT